MILGKPNAGKSSLLNALLGYDRAIVTDVAGTTRDTVEEKVQVGHVCCVCATPPACGTPETPWSGWGCGAP